MPLKAVLIAPHGTVYQNGQAQPNLLEELVLFIQRMQARGVHVGLWSRHPVTCTSHGRTERVETFLSRATGASVPFYQAASGDLPARRMKGSAGPILSRLGVKPQETILVGNEQEDMLAGLHNQLLLVRPEWYPASHSYGFEIPSIGELAQFCELFGLRRYPIYWSINSNLFRVRAMGPFSTFSPDFAAFGADARNAAKLGGGTLRFWFLMIISSLYFSGLIHEVDYICPFPGHNPAVPSAPGKGFDAIMSTLGKCFNKTYLPDLILRHVTSTKSQPIKAANRTFLNHLNTLHLNRYPRKYEGEPRKSPISLRDERVLVVDDICTSGRSLDVARAYIEAAGGSAVLFAWLKTINVGFAHMRTGPTLRPFEANLIGAEPPALEYRYSSNIVSHGAPAEIEQTRVAYRRWKWP
jgi:hypothetical protein